MKKTLSFCFIILSTLSFIFFIFSVCDKIESFTAVNSDLPPQTIKNRVVLSDENAKYYSSNNDLIIEEKKCDYEKLKHMYYNELNEDEQLLYDKIYNSLKHKEDLELRDKEITQNIDKIYKYVCFDNPDIWNIDGYFIENYNYESKAIFRGNYITTPEEDDIINRKLIHFITAGKTLANNSDNDYEIAQAVYEYVIQNVSYNMDAKYGQSLASIALNGESVCSGYAKMYQFLMNNLNIPTTLITGYVIQNGKQISHIWNLVFIDGNWYNVDCTYGDISSNDYIDINYDYLCISDNDILKTHTINSIIELPSCVYDNMNYYAMHNYIAEECSIPEIERVYQHQYSNKKYIRFLNKKDYNNFINNFINEERLFSMLQTDSFSFILNENLNTICIVVN